VGFIAGAVWTEGRLLKTGTWLGAAAAGEVPSNPLQTN